MRSRLILTLVLAIAAALAPPAASGWATPAPPTAYEHLGGLPEAFGPLASGSAHVSEQVETPIPFTTVGFERPVRFRTSVDGKAWTDWMEAEPADGAPDAREAQAAAARTADETTESYWVREARFLQVSSSDTPPSQIGVHLVDSDGLSRSLPERVVDSVAAALRPRGSAAHAATGLDFVSRAEWGADESLRNGGPDYAKAVRFGAVHHTVNANDYTAAEAPSIVRGIYRYHTQARGWDDIGYNALVDRFGRVYEGRAGGLTRPVIAAHAAGFNTGSTGVSVIGTFSHDRPSREAVAGVVRYVTWKFHLHGIDPMAKISVTSGGSSSHPKGKILTLSTLVGHRELGSTACPGDHLFDLVDRVRADVASKLGSAPPPPPPATSPFTDIIGSPHEQSILDLHDAGVTKGCAGGLFCPGMTVTRGQMASFLVRSFDNVEPVDGQVFRDVAHDHPHASAINGVAAVGITEGYEDGRFRPDQRLSRAHMGVFLHRALGLDLVWGFPFEDLPRDDIFVRPRVNALAEAKITNGCTKTKFCPTKPVSRAQMATFLVRAMADM